MGREPQFWQGLPEFGYLLEKSMNPSSTLQEPRFGSFWKKILSLHRNGKSNRIFAVSLYKLFKMEASRNPVPHPFPPPRHSTIVALRNCVEVELAQIVENLAACPFSSHGQGEFFLPTVFLEEGSFISSHVIPIFSKSSIVLFDKRPLPRANVR